ncbi:hypothetical protein A5706_07965 [Mycobacterium sp. E796]|nr:hypothetical protein A5706_07965 [Mycobacterium sp. E796]
MNPFHACRADERQPALYGEFDCIAHASLRDELIDQPLTHDVELFGDDRPDCGVIRQRAAIDRHRFIWMIDKRLDVGFESGGKLLRER